MANVSKQEKLSAEQFCLKAIKALRKGQYKGIHTVFSGFNVAFREYYGDKLDPIVTIDALIKEGKIEGHFVKKGKMIYAPGDMPERTDQSGVAALKAMGLSL